MGFRNPITTAIDPVARQAANAAQTTANQAIVLADDPLAQIPDGALPGSKLAADAIDGRTITGSTLRTAATGQRVQIDSTNGLVGYNAAGAAVTQVSPATGALVATGATITGEIDTGAAGTARVRIYEGEDGKGNPMGIVAFEEGLADTVAPQMSANAYGAMAASGGGLTIDGGSYAGVAAPTLVLQVDQAGESSAQLTAPQGFLVNGNPAVALSGANSSLSGGTFPGTAVPQLRAGTTVVTTNAAGAATVQWPAFAAGLITVLLSLGGSAGNPGDLQPTSYALNGVTFTAHTPAGAVLANATFRVNYLAVGW